MADNLDVRLTVDDTLLEVLRRDRSGWSAEKISRLAQVGALLIAAGWAYYIYATFQKESNRLALDAARQQMKQADLALEHTKLEIQRSKVEVDKLSQTPISTKETLQVIPIDLGGQSPNSVGAYLVSYDYTLTNAGS